MIKLKDIIVEYPEQYRSTKRIKHYKDKYNIDNKYRSVELKSNERIWLNFEDTKKIENILNVITNGYSKFATVNGISFSDYDKKRNTIKFNGIKIDFEIIKEMISILARFK